MKLIRLHSEKSNAEFETRFQEDIVIEPNSKIALSNLTFTSNDDKFVINSSNDTIDFQMTAAEGLLRVTIPHQTITAENVNLFFEELTRLFNAKLNFSGKRIGGQWRIAQGNKDIQQAEEEGFINFSYVRTIFYDGLDPNDGATNIEIINTLGVQAVAVFGYGPATPYRHISGVLGDTALINQQLYASQVPLAKGAATVRFTLDQLSDTGNGLAPGFTTSDNGVALCLMSKDCSNTTNFTIADIVFGIYADIPGQPYRLIHNGAESVPNAAFTINNPVANADNNDVLEIRKSQGLYKVFVHTSTGNYNLLENIEYEATDLHPLIIFKGDQNHAIISRFRMTADPYIHNIYELRFRNYRINRYEGIDPVRNSHLDLVENYTHGVAPNTGNTPTTFTQASRTREAQFRINFSSPRLSEYFGFEGQLALAYTGSNSIIEGETPFTIFTNENTYLVELLNIDIDSYDSLHEGRRNILKVVPVRSGNRLINYEANNLTFLDIKNAYKQTLRNIKARILDAYLEPIKAGDDSNLTILIKSSNE